MTALRLPGRAAERLLDLPRSCPRERDYPGGSREPWTQTWPLGPAPRPFSPGSYSGRAACLARALESACWRSKPRSQAVEQDVVLVRESPLPQRPRPRPEPRARSLRYAAATATSEFVRGSLATVG